MLAYSRCTEQLNCWIQKIGVANNFRARALLGGMIASGAQADLVLEILCRWWNRIDEKLSVLWLLYKAATGGSLDTITSMLSSSHEYTALVAARSSYMIKTLTGKLIDIFDLLKSENGQ